MIIPPEHLSPDTLAAVLEDYITREGTDYGEQELDLSTKLSILQSQIRSAEVVIVYDQLSESINLMTAEDYRQWQQSMAQ